MKGKIRLLVVDDEPRARQLIRKLVSSDHEVVIAGECANGFEAIEALQKRTADVMFLDIQMPEMDGFALLQKLKGWELPIIVFVTAFDRYALQAFDVHALDYLLKPFDRERFLGALQRAKAQVRASRGLEQNQQIIQLLEGLRRAETYLERIAVREKGRMLLLRVGEIEWIEAQDNYVRLNLGTTSHMLRATLGNLGRKLNPDQFVRVHRSAIVNLERLKQIHPQFHGDYSLELLSGAEVTLSRSYRERFFEKFGRSQ